MRILGSKRKRKDQTRVQPVLILRLSLDVSLLLIMFAVFVGPEHVLLQHSTPTGVGRPRRGGGEIGPFVEAWPLVAITRRRHQQQRGSSLPSSWRRPRGAYDRGSPRCESQRPNPEEGILHTDKVVTFDQENNEVTGGGLYRPVAEAAWQKILDRVPSLEPVPLAPDLAHQSVLAKGTHQVPGTCVAVETRAARGSSVIRYARLALLETLAPPSSSTGQEVPVSTTGIQVLNMVIFPTQVDLPVWGADLVSLPGPKHLLLVDAQPMSPTLSFHSNWQNWYQQHDIPRQYPWGGDMPDRVKPYVSPLAWWTRFSPASSPPGEDPPTVDPLAMLQSPALVQAILDHLDIYLEILLQPEAYPAIPSIPPTDSTGQPLTCTRSDYLQYRRDHDPARPMLKALFGEAWTERVLHEVLFPAVDA